MLVTYHIKILDRGGNAEVTATPAGAQLKKGRDTVKFTSNDSRTVIQYGATSPFAESEVGPNTMFEIGSGSGKGPFLAVTAGKDHHFDCGFRNLADSGKFSPWGRTDGADTPVEN